MYDERQTVVDTADVAFKQSVLRALRLETLLLTAARHAKAHHSPEALYCCHRLLYYFVKVRRSGPDWGACRTDVVCTGAYCTPLSRSQNRTGDLCTGACRTILSRSK